MTFPPYFVGGVVRSPITLGFFFKAIDTQVLVLTDDKWMVVAASLGTNCGQEVPL
jgi:hypothetical protein